MHHALGVPPKPDIFIAQTAEQARLLQDIGHVSVLASLLRAEASAGEVARHTHQHVKQAHYKLGRLLAAGLIEVCAERPRGGRPVKVYRPVATEYRVPFALTDAASIGELIHEAHRPLLDRHYQSISRQKSGGDLRIRQNESGRLEMMLDEPDREELPLVQSLFGGYRLTVDSARELERRLGELAQWLSEQAIGREEEGTDYLMGLLIAPGRLGED